MDDSDKILEIKKLLSLANQYPCRVIKIEDNGIILDFFIKKAFWHQIYGRFIIELIKYPSYLSFNSYQEIIQSEKWLLERKDFFAAETEQICVAEVKRVLLNLKKINNINILEASDFFSIN